MDSDELYNDLTDERLENPSDPVYSSLHNDNLLKFYLESEFKPSDQFKDVEKDVLTPDGVRALYDINTQSYVSPYSQTNEVTPSQSRGVDTTTTPSADDVAPQKSDDLYDALRQSHGITQNDMQQTTELFAKSLNYNGPHSDSNTISNLIKISASYQSKVSDGNLKESLIDGFKNGQLDKTLLATASSKTDITKEELLKTATDRALSDIKQELTETIQQAANAKFLDLNSKYIEKLGEKFSRTIDALNTKYPNDKLTHLANYYKGEKYDENRLNTYVDELRDRAYDALGVPDKSPSASEIRNAMRTELLNDHRDKMLIVNSNDITNQLSAEITNPKTGLGKLYDDYQTVTGNKAHDLIQDDGKSIDFNYAEVIAPAIQKAMDAAEVYEWYKNDNTELKNIDRAILTESAYSSAHENLSTALAKPFNEKAYEAIKESAELAYFNKLEVQLGKDPLNDNAVRIISDVTLTNAWANNYLEGNATHQEMIESSIIELKSHITDEIKIIETQTQETFTQALQERREDVAALVQNANNFDAEYAKLTEDLTQKYQAEYDSLDEGLEKTVYWYKQIEDADAQTLAKSLNERLST